MRSNYSQPREEMHHDPSYSQHQDPSYSQPMEGVYLPGIANAPHPGPEQEVFYPIPNSIVPRGGVNAEPGYYNDAPPEPQSNDAPPEPQSNDAPPDPQPNDVPPDPQPNNTPLEPQPSGGSEQSYPPSFRHAPTYLAIAPDLVVLICAILLGLPLFNVIHTVPWDVKLGFSALFASIAFLVIIVVIIARLCYLCFGKTFKNGWISVIRTSMSWAFLLSVTGLVYVFFSSIPALISLSGCILFYIIHTLRTWKIRNAYTKTTDSNEDPSHNQLGTSPQSSKVAILALFIFGLTAFVPTIENNLKCWRHIDRHRILPLYSDAELMHPKSKDELLSMLIKENTFFGTNVYGSGYSFAITKTLPSLGHRYISTTDVNLIEMIDDNVHVYVEAGATFGQVHDFLAKRGRALVDFPSFADISLGSAVKVKAHGFSPRTFVTSITELTMYDSITNMVQITNSTKTILNLDLGDRYTVLSMICETIPVETILVTARHGDDIIYPINIMPRDLQNNTEWIMDGKTASYRRYDTNQILPRNSKLTDYTLYSQVHKYGSFFGLDRIDYIDGKYFETNKLFLYSSYNLFDKMWGDNIVNWEVAMRFEDYQKIRDVFVPAFKFMSTLRIDLRRQGNIVWIDAVHSDTEPTMELIKLFWGRLGQNDIKFYVHEGKYIPQFSLSWSELRSTLGEIYDL